MRCIVWSRSTTTMDRRMQARYRLWHSYWAGGYIAYGIHDTMLERCWWQGSLEQREGALELLESLGSDELWSSRAEELGWNPMEHSPDDRVYEEVSLTHAEGSGKHTVVLDG